MDDLNYLSGPHNLAEAVADVGGTIQKFLNFMQIFSKFWQNRTLAPPPTGNPRSAPGKGGSLIPWIQQ